MTIYGNAGIVVWPVCSPTHTIGIMIIDFLLLYSIVYEGKLMIHAMTSFYLTFKFT